MIPRRFATAGAAVLAAFASVFTAAPAQASTRHQEPPGPGPAPSVFQQPSDAFLDAGARELVHLGRVRRNTVDRSIDRYTTIVQERISAGLRAAALERLVYRRETAGRIDWRRSGPVRIEVLGAREAIPIALKNVQVPGDLRSFMPHVAFDPVDNDIFVRFDTTFLRHPLADDSESHYRFRSGDTTTIRLPDGRSIRLLELVVIPRSDDVHLLSGSFWFDADSHAVVRAVFRPARAYDFDRDADEGDEAPGFLKPIRADLLYITIEYGLWELRWWLPRVIAAEGVFQISFVSMPLRYERRYSAYTVEGDTTRPAIPAAVPSVAADSIEDRPCRPPFSLQVNVGNEPDSARVRRREERQSRRTERAGSDSARARRDRDRECLESVEVVVPKDSAALLASAYLPASIYAGEAALLTRSDLEQLERALDRLPAAPWQARPPTFAWGLGAAGLVRYNRVESLSLGATAGIDFGRLSVDATARIGLADLEPNGDISLIRETPAGLRRFSIYRRLAPANPETRPLGTGNSFNALFFGRDDGEYFRSIGAELHLRPARSDPQWYELRLYGEHQKPAATGTDFSVRHLFDSDHAFRQTIEAATADQFGAQLSLRASYGLDPASVRLAGEIGLHGEAGTFEFARPSATLRASVPFGDAALALEAAAGTSFGTPPIQSEWFLGGPATLRGYDGGVAHGVAFWRGRAEFSRGLPAARISLFTDVGWAGDRADFGTRNALAAAGTGAAFLDGLIRLDLARALEPPAGWRLDLHVSRSF